MTDVIHIRSSEGYVAVRWFDGHSSGKNQKNWGCSTESEKNVHAEFGFIDRVHTSHSSTGPVRQR